MGHLCVIYTLLGDHYAGYDGCLESSFTTLTPILPIHEMNGELKTENTLKMKEGYTHANINVIRTLKLGDIDV